MDMDLYNIKTNLKKLNIDYFNFQKIYGELLYQRFDFIKPISKIDLLELISRLNDTDVDEENDEDDEDGELGEDIIEILRLKKLMQEKKQANENEKFKNMSNEDVMKYWDNK